MGVEKKTSFRNILARLYKRYLYFRLPNELKHLEEPNTLLLESAKMWSRAGIKYALLLGADVNAKNGNDKTALVFASEHGHTEIVELLIQKGADIISAYKEYGTRKIINQIVEEKPELVTKEQKFMLNFYSNPWNISPDKRKEVIEVLREFRKKGIIGKEESLELFSNLQKEWNKKTDIKIDKEMRKPTKPDRKNLKRINNVM